MKKLPPAPGGGRRTPRPPPRRKSSGLLLGLVYLVLFVVVAAGGMATFLLLNPPTDLIRSQIADVVKARTGRDLAIAGGASLRFFPSIGISLADVGLSGPPGVPGNFVKMDGLDLNLSAKELLSRQIKVTSLRLRKPVFELRVDKAGKNNWDFAALPRPVQYAELVSKAAASDVPIQVAADASQPQAQSSGDLDVQLDDVSVEDATFRFTDERSGQQQQVSPVNVSFRLPSLQSPLVASGTFDWRGRTITFDGKLTTIDNVLHEKPSRLAFSVRNDLVTAAYDGGLLVKDGAYLEGDVNASVPSTRALANWFGTALPPVTGFGPLSIRGTLKSAGNATSFSNAEFALDGATAKGAVDVKTGGVRPLFNANLNISELDLNKYLTSAVTGDEPSPAPTSGGAPSNSETLAPGGTGGKKDGEPDAIEKLLNSRGTKVYGSVQRAGWSNETLNTTLLGVADGNARLRVASLRFKNVSVGESAMTLGVKNRVMQANLDDVALYGGHGKGTVKIDGTGDGVAVASNMLFDGVSAAAFLKDAANFDKIDGKANVAVDVTANGSSQLQLVESLNGTSRFHFSNGSIVGFNVPAAIRGVSKGDFSGLKSSPTAKTDFSEMKASFKITNGVAENQDLSLVSPLLRVTGSGTAHLPGRTIDYTLMPKLVASLEGQDSGAGVLSGIEVPVRVTGAMDNPQFKIDVNGALNNPNTVETIKQIGKRFKGKNAGEIVDDLFGKKSGSSDGSKSSAKDILNKLFKKQGDDE